jgi:hypothetical protein
MYRLRCYRRDVATYPTYRIARAAAERHIRDCPEGPMPWARRIRWHSTRPAPTPARTAALETLAAALDVPAEIRAWPYTGLNHWHTATTGPMWAAAAHGEWLDHIIAETPS